MIPPPKWKNHKHDMGKFNGQMNASRHGFEMRIERHFLNSEPPGSYMSYDNMATDRVSLKGVPQFHELIDVDWLILLFRGDYYWGVPNRHSQMMRSFCRLIRAMPAASKAC